MSFRVLGSLAAAFALAACKTPAPAPTPPELRTTQERFSYALGAKLGGEVRASGHELDPELVQRGMQDGLANRSALSDEELAEAMSKGLEAQTAKRDALREERAQRDVEAGRAFLEANRARPGVVALASGLQYEVLRPGDGGATPGPEDFVSCNYRGTLLDGTIFDDTASIGRPRNFAVSSVIDGFEEALLRMPVGARWKIFVPPELGYGKSRVGSPVPPSNTLIFEIELVEIGKRPDR